MKNIVYAKNKYVRGSARKARLVIDLIRGKNALYAVDILKFTNKAATVDIGKTLDSAIANAVFNSDMKKDELVVVEAYVNESNTYKRGIAVSRGRYHQIKKRNSHIVIGVSDGSSATKKEKTVAKKEAKVTAAPKAEVKKSKVAKTTTKTKAKSTKAAKTTKSTTTKVTKSNSTSK